ncbi:MAG: hypothetical protein RL198_629 [Actinomycetota bacterium]
MNPSWQGGTALDPKLRQESAIPALHAALGAGVRLLDTADIYAPTWRDYGHNELLVREAVDSWSASPSQKAEVVIATKAGIARRPGEEWGRNSSLDYLLRAAEASAARLGVDKIQLWQHHRQDPTISFEQQFENVLVLKERGIVDQIGVSNYDAKQLEVAVRMGGKPQDGGVISVQNQLSPRYRHELGVLEVCEKHGIAFLPWSPLGGSHSKAEIAPNSQTIFEQVGAELGLSPYATALAWLLKMSPTMIPIPGPTRVETVADCLTATSVELTDEQFERIQANLPKQVDESEELYPKPAYRDAVNA